MSSMTISIMYYVGISLIQYVSYVFMEELMKKKRGFINRVIKSAILVVVFIYSASFTSVNTPNSGFYASIYAFLSSFIVFFIDFKVWKSKKYKEFIIYHCFLQILYLFANELLCVVMLMNATLESFILCWYLSILFTFVPMLLVYYLIKKIDLTRIVSGMVNHRTITFLIVFVSFANMLLLSYTTQILVEGVRAFNATLDMNVIRAAINQIMIITTIDLAVSIAVISFASYLYLNIQYVQEQKVQLLHQQLYIQKLETLQQNMRTLRHDYKNIISGMYLQAKEGDIEGIQNFLQSTINSFDDQVGDGLRMTNQISNLKVLQIKSLVLVKVMEMEQQGILCHIEIPKEIARIHMDIVEFNRCLGILIDNAMEEVINHDSKKIDLLLVQDDQELLVVVKNPIMQKPILQRIWEEGYSTKGSNRGLGLSSYTHILNRYENVTKQTICQANEFSQMFTIMNPS